MGVAKEEPALRLDLPLDNLKLAGVGLSVCTLDVGQRLDLRAILDGTGIYAFAVILDLQGRILAEIERKEDCNLLRGFLAAEGTEVAEDFCDADYRSPVVRRLRGSLRTDPAAPGLVLDD